MNTRIYYIAPDFDTPSWGMGMIYQHVRLLNNLQLEAYVMHLNIPFKITWTTIQAPVCYLDSTDIVITDVLVVPEVMATDEKINKINCRKIVFVQAAYYILQYSNKFFRYPDFGYEIAICTMPHIEKIVKLHFHSNTKLITPFVAPYFNIGKLNSIKSRKKHIVVYPKKESNDYDILIKFLRNKYYNMESRKVRYNIFNSGWKFIELKDKSHLQVAEVMKSASFFISLNVMEGFNASVAEAMASGCSVLCYEGYGAADYLENNKNAFVFKDHDIYALIETLFDLTDNFEKNVQTLDTMRVKAIKTLDTYTENRTQLQLKALFCSK